MRGSRNFCQKGGGGGGGGGGGVEARRPENSLDNVFFFFNSSTYFTVYRVDPMVFYYRGEEGVQLLPGDGGVQRNPCNLSFSRGGGGGEGGPEPLTPLWIRTWGRQTPLFACRI